MSLRCRHLPRQADTLKAEGLGSWWLRYPLGACPEGVVGAVLRSPVGAPPAPGRDPRPTPPRRLSPHGGSGVASGGGMSCRPHAFGLEVDLTDEQHVALSLGNF